MPEIGLMTLSNIKLLHRSNSWGEGGIERERERERERAGVQFIKLGFQSIQVNVLLILT